MPPPWGITRYRDPPACLSVCLSHSAAALSRGRGASVEQSARFRHGVNVAAHVQATPEDCTVREKLLSTGCFRRLEHHRTSFYLRLILFGVFAVVLTLYHLNHIRLLTN